MDDLLPDTDLYALLHVSHDASTDEIQKAYRYLATVCHPDKYLSTQMKEVATDNFQKIRTACEILTDFTKRQIYDLYGLKGLNSGMELGPVLKTKEEVFSEYEKARIRKQHLKEAFHTAFNGSFVMSVDFSETLLNWEEYPEISTMQMGTQVQTKISENNFLIFGSNIATKDRSGGGNFFLVFRRNFSSFQNYEILTMIGSRPIITFSTSRQITPNVNATLGISKNIFDEKISITNSWTRQLSETTKGTINVNFGEENYVSASLQKNGIKNSISGDIKVGANILGLSGSFIRKFSEKSSGRMTLRFGTFGIDCEIGGNRKISEYSSFGFFYTIGVQGILWKVKYIRGTQKFVFPILLSQNLNPFISIPAFLLPFSFYAIFKKYVLKPYIEKRKRKKEIEKRKENFEQVKLSKKSAFESQTLLSSPSERKKKMQEEKKGLVILFAIYGNLNEAEPFFAKTKDGKKVTNGKKEKPKGDESQKNENEEGENEREGEREDGDKGMDDDLLRNDKEEEEEEEEEMHGVDFENMDDVPFIDVKIPLQFFVEDVNNQPRLHFYQGIHKKGLMGFCDPCPGEEKKLKIKYKFNDMLHQVCVDDLEELDIPNTSHRII